MSYALCNLGEVFIAHRAQLRAIAYNVVKSPAVAEEIMHNCLRLAEGSCARDVEKPYSYCCQVVRNLALDYCRRLSLEETYRVYTDDGELPDVPGPASPDQVLHERRRELMDEL
jgi:RNA polymerase sigma-70 factor (ECF subfamily)